MNLFYLFFCLSWAISILAAPNSVYYDEVAMDRSAKSIYASNSFGIFISTNFGNNWTQVSTCVAPSSFDISGDGQYAMAVFDPSGVCGPVLITANFGKDWFKPSFPRHVTTVRDGDISENGQYMIIANFASGNGKDEIFMSNDFGISFQPVAHSDSINLYSTVMSRSGNQIYVGQSVGILFLSQSYGVSFSPLATVPNTGYYSRLNCDDDCLYLLATTSSGVNLSNDSGVTWKSTTLPNNGAYHTVLSSSGQYQYAAGNRDFIYRSDNYGLTWQTSTDSPRSNWASLDCDQSGAYVIASSVEKGVYLSSDYGETWKLSNL
jgi:photosystem II stability/assembly factor-like uncharacterized protein